MSEQKLVSVIIPVYNRADYLEECVESVFAQSHGELEIILIDDGSTDNSLALCHELRQRDGRVRVLESAHLGVSGARNMGLDAARGEYVFFLDSDDIIHPELLKTLLAGLLENEATLGGISYRISRVENWERDRERFLQSQPRFPCTYHDYESALRAVFDGRSPFDQMGGTIMSRNLIGDTRFRTELSIGEDFFFIYENLIKGVGAVFLGPNWYLARQHGGNSSWDYSFDGFWSRFKRRELVWKSELEFGRTEYARGQKLDALCCFSKCVSKNKPYSVENRKIRKAVKRYKAELLPAMSRKQKIGFLLRLYCPMCAWVVLDRCKREKQVKRSTSPARPLQTTDRTEAHKELLLDFLNTPLDDGGQILERFAALSGAVMGTGEKPLQRYVYVPGNRFPDGVVLVAHTDTVWDRNYDKPFSGEQTVKFENGVFSGTDPEAGIGADDRAGCAMLWAMRHSGHSLLVVDGEEHGKHGARYLQKSNPKLFRLLNRHCYMIELDWMGTRSCLFNQVDNTKRFKADIQEALDLDDGGAKGGSDLQVLCRHVCGVNLGVGYHGCHKSGETLVLAEWENTLAELSAFLAQPQRRYRTKLLPYHLRRAGVLAGRPFRAMKKLIKYKSNG
ncbi:MAG: glycosyltransferase [Ruminococcaceae bacterium]|nr:glycosyltransferase [Oscillospiraceae bacterium]